MSEQTKSNTTVAVRLDPRDHQWLILQAEFLGISKSDLLRMIVSEARGADRND